MNRRKWITSILLILLLVVTFGSLSAWKYLSIQKTNELSANQPEPMESVTVSIAKERDYNPTMVSIGTVLALKSVTLRNELSGTVKEVMLTPGKIVDKGTLLIALDVSEEEAELNALQARAALADTMLKRMKYLTQNQAASQEELDQASAEHQVAIAQIARIKAIIDKKKILAPFRSRIGISDVHPGQYLNVGTQLTTLQGVDESVHIDFTVPQWVAQGLQEGASVLVHPDNESSIPINAEIVAVDARIDPDTRNAMVRSRITGYSNLLKPGSSVRVRVPSGSLQKAVSVPVSALRKGPDGDHVFVIAADSDGKQRAHKRWVKSGDMIRDEVLILSGLSPGEQVAASGSFKLHESMLVTITKDPTADSGTGK